MPGQAGIQSELPHPVVHLLMTLGGGAQVQSGVGAEDAAGRRAGPWDLLQSEGVKEILHVAVRNEVELTRLVDQGCVGVRDAGDLCDDPGVDDGLEEAVE
ncbi:hypothetical protein [Streptomyces sp. enrichment culture]|uniref:hypothetical protein n=1 Tax=Streptomyces sp. enrichment culture TaxID=1795815 RepID=UPI003F566D71